MLTAFNDNALITYLATLVPNMSESAKLAVVEGAVTGGGLTVIANEQVKDGTCERCESKVMDKEMPEWAFRITKYSQVLLDALDGLDRWPDKVRLMQKNWIGRSEGLLVRFMLDPATTPNSAGAMPPPSAFTRSKLRSEMVSQ